MAQDPVCQQCQEHRDCELDERQERGAVEVELEPKRLIYRQLHGGRAWPAAKREGNRKAHGADHEDHQRGTRHHLPQHRPFEMPVHGARIHAEARRQAKALGRDFLPALQDEPRRQRKVEEDMSQDDAMEPVDRNLRQPQHSKP